MSQRVEASIDIAPLSAAGLVRTQELKTTGSFAVQQGLRALRGTRGGVPFASILFLLSLSSLSLVRELQASPAALLSYTLQQGLVWVAFLLLDQRSTTRRARFAWAALGTLYTAISLLDGLLMRMTSLPLRELLPMVFASQHVVEALREVGLKPWRLAILGAALLSAAASGGFFRLLLAHLAGARVAARLGAKGAEPPRKQRARTGALVILCLMFALEQTSSREADDYLYRGLSMPAYLQLYDTTSRSIELPLEQPVSSGTRAAWLEQVAPAESPRHVLYVLLESFRADAIAPDVCPTMWEIAQSGAVFDNALSEATFTPLSWSVLLFDEAAHDNLFGRLSRPPEPLGSWLVAVMEKAGYDPHVFVSTNFKYANTRERLLGSNGRRLDFFQAAPHQGDDPADKNSNDRVVVDHTVKFVRDHDWQGKAQLLVLQLDSTHYTYPFPESEAIFTPYSENLTLPRPIETQREAALLHNRYKNAARFVDSQLRRVVNELKRAGVYEEMAIVLTADHGEGLKPGQQGHGAVSDITKRVPLIFKLPGRSPSRSSQLISHRDILPTLTDYLGIAMPAAATRGRTASDASSAVLTLAPSGRFAQLTTADSVFDLHLRFKPRSVIVTPATGHDAAPEASPWLQPLKAFLASPSAHTAATARR